MRRMVMPAIVAVALLAACGGGGGPKSKSMPPTTYVRATTPSNSLAATDVPNSCALLKAGQVKAALGTFAFADDSELNRGTGGPAYSGCTWGKLAGNDAVVAVQVSRPSGPGNVDYARTYVDAIGEKGTPVAVGKNGRLLSHAFIPGGSGAGQSIMFTKNGITVVVGLVRGNEAKLKAAAAAVAANMH